ncbi:hypothetical protein [Mesorhizobium sp. M1B.F.Ca.ET.045.04.1.1]|uniref:hypothetical protein n=1 Tax=Mesorhizobium sp. M1B.F.Ca.ET.045.04.1.1 TaxID=2493673 RepID=UPI000F74DD47|nr:hypothetical protein [Mesorhizobium sp. M1B.F.Ca.ET.045.04.1.1]AZO29329.1 hypothetical protein EJ071_19380 [Mesorhizobium sp. M1B.F.Ca.ET.045.04.1.1]
MMKAGLFLAAFLALSPAHAEESKCSKWGALKQALADKFHEVQIAAALINDHAMMAVFASPGGETWTTVAVGVDGTACVLTVGTGWAVIAPPGDHSGAPT